MVNKVPSEWQSWEPILKKLRQEVKKAYKLSFSVNLSHIEQFIDDPKNTATLYKMGLEDAQLELIYEVIDSQRMPGTENSIRPI